MDHEEPVLNLSDVVHDEPMDDDEHTSASDPVNDEPTSTPFPPTTAGTMSVLHESYIESSQNQHHLSNGEFSVEMLEREIATLLNQNASAASAALLNAAAQQRQAHLDQENGQDEDETRNPELTMSGLAAVLQAAHAQAENERAAEALAAKDPIFARQREAALAEKEKKTTRTAPAFHSLTAGEGSESARQDREDAKKGSDGSDYLYTDEGESDREEEQGRVSGNRQQRATPPISRACAPDSSRGSPHVPAEFPDLSDILLHHLSSQFEAESDHGHANPEPSTSPIDSHNRNADPQATPTLSLPSTSASAPPTRANRELAVAPTSTNSGIIDGAGKIGKKSKDKDKGPNVHICEQEQCRKSFTRRSDLARHMRIHTGERPFVCAHDGCGKTFIQRSALHVHLRVHTGEKPHSCEYPACGKTFGDSSSLARHRRTHTGKRPYKCEDPECEKTFTRRTTLTQHMRTHDPTWEPDPNIKYNFKVKKRKVAEDEDRELEESVRTISALLQSGGNSIIPNTAEYVASEEPLEAQVASIRAEIAAAIAQAQSRIYEDDEEEDVESGQEMASPVMIGPNTSGIRGDDGLEKGNGDNLVILQDDGDDDSDAFPIPLRTRRAKETVEVIGSKRKR